MENDFAMGIVSVMPMSILCYMVYQNNLFSIKMRRSFIRAILAVVVVIIAEVGTCIFDSTSAIDRALNMLFCIIGFGISPFIPVMIATAFENQRPKWRAIVYIPAVANLILTVLSPARGLIFRILSDNSYLRGSYFFVFVISYLFGMVFLLKKNMNTIHLYQNKNKLTLLGIFLFTLVGSTMQILWPSIHSTWISITIAMIMYYVYYSELFEKHDAVTNLFNRRAHEQHLANLEAKGYGSIILFDIDEFKQINDQFGHQYGDACLRMVAASIRISCAKIGLCHRIGGDEFSVLSESTDQQVIQDAETQFLKNMNAFRKQDPRLPAVSFGHAVYHGLGEGIEQVVEEADRQMYRYKKQHKMESRQTADSSFKRI